MSILKDIITLSAIIGFPLKGFACDCVGNPAKMWQLIGEDKSFTVEWAFQLRCFNLIFDVSGSVLITDHCNDQA